MVFPSLDVEAKNGASLKVVLPDLLNADSKPWYLKRKVLTTCSVTLPQSEQPLDYQMLCTYAACKCNWWEVDGRYQEFLLLYYEGLRRVLELFGCSSRIYADACPVAGCGSSDLGTCWRVLVESVHV